MTGPGQGRTVTAVGTNANPGTWRPPRWPRESCHQSGKPRLLRLPRDWWDTPPVVGCPLSRDPRSAGAARRLTRNTLRDWALASLAADAEMIVAELAANALTHGAGPEADRRPGRENLGVRLRRGTSELICAVFDPSESVPMLKTPGSTEHSGRGLQIVDSLSDVWGWSPVPDRGKAVWAVLFVPPGPD
jgi:anti-sigma regulatory factor (Ser/Thr protein kinase)